MVQSEKGIWIVICGNLETTFCMLDFHFVIAQVKYQYIPLQKLEVFWSLELHLKEETYSSHCLHQQTTTLLQRFNAALLPWLLGSSIPGHTTRVPQVLFELTTNCILHRTARQLLNTASGKSTDKTAIKQHWHNPLLTVLLSPIIVIHSGAPGCLHNITSLIHI